jgi:Phage integrase, N-terminal SAM-like domain
LEEPSPLEIMLQEYGQQWLATDVALRLKPATAEKYVEVLRKHWLPELGKLPLSAITRDHVKTILQRKLMGGMKPNMGRIMLTVLRACLSIRLWRRGESSAILQRVWGNSLVARVVRWTFSRGRI